MIWHVQPHTLVQIQYPAQRWIAFQDIGLSPGTRWNHAMASDGTRVFVLGGLLPADTGADKKIFIHVLDTSMSSLFVISFGQPSRLKTQIVSITPNPTPMLSILLRRPPNSCRTHPRVPRPRDNHSSRHLR